VTSQFPKAQAIRCLVAVAVFSACASAAFAAHPLITDDTGTQGMGKSQLEVNGEYGSDRETPAPGIVTVERSIEAAATLSYGVLDSLDAVIGVPHLWVEARETNSTIPDSLHASEKGLSDASVELKWRFFECEGLSLAVKPGISVPTGDEHKGLGAGKYGFSTHLIATQEMERWMFHLNLAYVKNNNRADERENLYHISLATEYSIKESVRIVTNIGQDRNPDRTADSRPVFALAGVIYSIAKDVDIDVGFKTGITDPETDSTVLAGMAFRF
jgi:hypothetical protein